MVRCGLEHQQLRNCYHLQLYQHCFAIRPVVWRLRCGITSQREVTVAGTYHDSYKQLTTPQDAAPSVYQHELCVTCTLPLFDSQQDRGLMNPSKDIVAILPDAMKPFIATGLVMLLNGDLLAAGEGQACAAIALV